MIEHLLLRVDVCKLLEEIANNSRYYQKKTDDMIDYQYLTERQDALFLFYDALIKYQIVIEEDSYFEEYLEQIEKLLKKIDNFSDISLGIHRILGNIVAQKLGCKNKTDEINKQKILQYIYNRYIIHGYYFHGIASVYQEDIAENGFIPEQYINLYPDFIKAQKMMDKYGVSSVLEKDFSSHCVFFTDSFFKSLSYSVNAPFYFMNLLCNPEIIKKKDFSQYSLGNKKTCFKNLKRFLAKYEFSYEDRSFLLDLFQKEWALLNKKEAHPCVVLVKRSHFLNNSSLNFSTIMEQSLTLPLEESIAKIFHSQDDNICCSSKISKEEITIVSLPSLRAFWKQEETEIEEEENFDCSFELQNAYGKISLFILFGLFFITLGVLVTVILLVRGI